MPTATGLNLLQATGWAVINSLWQFAFVWILYKALAAAFHRKGPGFRSSLATLSLFAGFSWVIITLVQAFVTTPESSILSSALFLLTNDTAPGTGITAVLPFAGILYITVLLLPLRQFIKNYRYLCYIRKHGLSRAGAGVRLYIQKTAAYYGISKQVTVWLSEMVNSPVTIGFLKPIILIPVAAINHLTTQQLEAVLLHELSHIKRNDYLVNFVITIIKTVLYYNPFTRWLIREIENEREFSCDQTVTQYGFNPIEYSTALLLLEKEAAAPSPFLLAATGSKSTLRSRVEHLAGIRTEDNQWSKKLLALFLTFLLILSSGLWTHMDKGLFSERIASFFPVDMQKTQKMKLSVFPAEPIAGTLSENTEVPPATSPPKHLNGLNTKNLKEYNQVLNPVPDQIESGLRFANFTIPDLDKKVVLSEKQEKEIQATVASAKKIAEEASWKEMEKAYADALSSLEKEKIKIIYEKQLQAQNWKELEQKVKANFNNINWEKVNAKIDYSLDQIRLDSIQNAMNLAITELKTIQDKMQAYQVSVIPDTDLSLKEIEEQKKMISDELNKLRATRSKKIIRL